MPIATAIAAALLLIAAFIFTRHFWDKPEDTVDMVKKFDVILKKAYSLGEDAKIIELRDNFIKVGVRNHNGEKAFMVKQRPENEFRVIYIVKYDPVYTDLKIEHVYKDDADQNAVVAQFEKEIEKSLVPRKK